jgi:Family of unknown function (DUF6176)
MQARCIRIKLCPGTTERVIAWLQSFNDRRPEALAAMRNSGIFWESAFVDRRQEGDEVLLVQCSEDFERTSAAFLSSDLPIDTEARAVLSEVASETTVSLPVVFLIPDPADHR